MSAVHDAIRAFILALYVTEPRLQCGRAGTPDGTVVERCTNIATKRVAALIDDRIGVLQFCDECAADTTPRTRPFIPNGYAALAWADMPHATAARALLPFLQAPTRTQ